MFILGKWPRLWRPRGRVEQVRAAHRDNQDQPRKDRRVIGPGGKNIKKMVEESGCEINIEDDGTVNIFSVSAKGMKIAADAIVGMTAEAEIDKIYRGKVVTIKDFGAFVEFLPGKDGLVHISELAQLPRETDRGHCETRR
jgi:polyribonucleotide nucleotidyltransferase